MAVYLRPPNVAYILIWALSFSLLYLVLGGIPNRQTFVLSREDKEPSNKFARSMSENIENLLNYIVEAGIKVDPEDIQRLIEASALSILKIRVPSIGPISETGENQGGFPWKKSILFA